MSDSLYASFAEVLELCQPIKDDLEALLHPSTGFAPRLRQICANQLADFEERTENKPTAEELDLLRLEVNTWSLLQAIMPARKTDPLPVPNPCDLLQSNPYTPISTLVQSVMNASPVFTELVVVREWLQETAPQPSNPEAVTGYWRFTKHSIMQVLRTEGVSGVAGRDGLVKHMDPDAPLKEERKFLAADDASHEKSLAQALYSYIRAGRLDEAADLCRLAHQPWRAASIRGSLLFKCKAISNENIDSAFDGGPESDAWIGNPHRKLWKSTCTNAALNPGLPFSERVIYAALAPSLQTSAVLESACRTWEDHVWALVSVLCEEKQTMEMSKLGGGWWEGGVAAVEKGVPKVPQETAQREEQEWEKEVTDALQARKAVRVEEGPSADHAFHTSQLHIITGQTDTLLEIFASGLRDGSYDPGSTEYTNMTRFFAHLCLFLQMIDTTVPPHATQVILEAYLQVLENAGQRELIAMYASALGDNAVERYATFLTSLELSVDITERKLALKRANEHSLDVARVAVATAERTIEKAFEILPSLTMPLPLLPVNGAAQLGHSLLEPPSNAELLLLRSIEWTTFEEATYSTALEQTNVILRYFLGAGRVKVAKILLGMLPPELASITQPEEMATEYLHYRQFFNIWDTLDRVVESQALDVPHMNRDTRVEWLRNYQSLLDDAREQIMKLLTSEWLITDVEYPGGDRRRHELIRMRQIYIPELVIRLHAILFASRQYVPANLKRALELANVVADSRYKLYEDFANEDGRRLGDYLDAVRQAVLGSLEKGGSDPFRIISES